METKKKSLEKPENSAQNARLHTSTLANLSVPSSSPLPPANRSCPFSDKNIESTFSSPSAFLGHSASMLLPGHLASAHSLPFSERHVHVPYECYILAPTEPRSTRTFPWPFSMGSGHSFRSASLARSAWFPTMFPICSHGYLSPVTRHVEDSETPNPLLREQLGYSH